jgi:hypothetical protein
LESFSTLTKYPFASSILEAVNDDTTNRKKVTKSFPLFQIAGTSDRL